MGRKEDAEEVSHDDHSASPSSHRYHCPVAILNGPV